MLLVLRHDDITDAIGHTTVKCVYICIILISVSLFDFSMISRLFGNFVVRTFERQTMDNDP